MYFLRINSIIKIIFCGILFFINISLSFAENIEAENETNELKYILSLDTGLTMIALKNLGIGIGVNYEHKLTDFLSIKPGFGHMACFLDTIVLTVDIQLFLYYYPLSNGLDKLYVGLGNACDFVMYPEKDNVQDDVVISIIPTLGWKWKMTNYLMIDPFIGWRFYVMETDNYDNKKEYLKNGFQWGINLKIFLQNK
jgi:hypothetical protein